MNTTRIDLLSPDVRRDPFPIYRELRRRAPACPIDPGGMWAVARYADVMAALHDPATFSSEGFRAAFAPEWLGDDRLARMMLVMDPPEHSNLRRLVSRQFGQDLLRSLEHPLRAYIQNTLEALDPRREIDVVAELATPIAAAVVAMLLDLDPAHHVRFKHWVDTIGSMTPVEPDAATVAAIRGVIAEEDAYFREVIESRRRAPGTDLVSLLLSSEIEGRSLTTEELVSFLVLLLGAGIDTTIHLLSKSLLLLSERSDLLLQLRADERLIATFLEEMLRYDPPTHALPRLTTRDVELGSTTIPAHSFVLLLLASANRDEAQFEDPDRFRLDRATRGTLAFGHGPHTCIGAALARFESRLVFEALLERFTAFERDRTAPIVWDAAIHTRGPLQLPMRLVRQGSARAV
ncbi:MAG TPA: cytochrome P450 [Polyangiales bacterium]|nr:cytochrome P450 [Polyangiales bacterium]